MSSSTIKQNQLPCLTAPRRQGTGVQEIKEHAAPGSILIMDIYSKRLLALKGVKATNEGFNFALDFSGDKENMLKAFVESENLSLGEFYFMGHKTKKGTLGVVTEIIL